MSLYREYRPLTFDDVVGQQHIVTTLEHSVAQDKLSHAYLFAGTRGTGKTTTARILAKALLTKGMTDATLIKQVQEAADEGSLVDLIEIDAASNTGVDNIRDLIEKIQFTPVVASAKVYIIDEVHMLSKGAFNALLKTLEEPPAYAYFILATTELHKVPMTIQSRCQRFLFRQIDEQDIVKRLRYIADQEKITVEDSALSAIAHHVGGAMRDAIGLLDQLRSLPQITREDVKERIGETGHEQVEHVMTAMQTGDRAMMLSVVRALEQTGVPMENFVRLLLESVRNQLHTAVNEKRSTADLEVMLDLFLQTVKDLRTAPVPGLVLEAALLSLCEAPSAKLPASSPVIPQQVVAPLAAQSPKPEASSDSPLDLPTLKTHWSTILEQVQPASSQMSLKNGQLHDVLSGIVIIRFSSSFHRDKASTVEALRNLEQAIEKETGKQTRVRCVLESEVHAPPPLPDSDSVDLAQAALDVF